MTTDFGVCLCVYVFNSSTKILIKSQDTRYKSGIVVRSMTEQINNRSEGEISKIVDQVLRQVFGREATQLIYKYLESKHSVKKDEIAQKIDIFAKGLEEFLNSGAYVIERKILEDIYSSYGLLRRLQLEKMHGQHGFVGQVKSLIRNT